MRIMLVIAAAGLLLGHAPPPHQRAAKHRRPRAAPASQIVRIDGTDYGPRTRFQGIYASAFEMSRFAGCWFTNSNDFARQFEERALPKPPAGQEIVRYELEFIGRQTVSSRLPTGGFGHMGVSSCQIRAETLISAKLLPPDAP